MGEGQLHEPGGPSLHPLTWAGSSGLQAALGHTRRAAELNSTSSTCGEAPVLSGPLCVSLCPLRERRVDLAPWRAQETQETVTWAPFLNPHCPQPEQRRGKGDSMPICRRQSHTYVLSQPSVFPGGTSLSLFHCHLSFLPLHTLPSTHRVCNLVLPTTQP